MLEGLEMMDTFLALIGLYLAASGLTVLISGQIYGHGRDFGVRYTEKSIRDAAPLAGIGMTVTGLTLVVFQLIRWVPALKFLDSFVWVILAGGVAAGAAVAAAGYHKLVAK